MLGELACDLEALGLRIGSAFATVDHLLRHRDSGHVLVDEPERRGCADEADRREQRGLRGKTPFDSLGNELVEEIGEEADLELEEARAGADLLERAIDAVLERRCARILDRAEEEVRRRVERAPGEVAAACHRLRGREQLQAVEVEHAARLGLVAGGHVVAGEAAEVLDPV